MDSEVINCYRMEAEGLGKRKTIKERVFYA